MLKTNIHKFHIPVMGISFTIDTPIKVARYGISSVISIIEDEMIEKMREYYCNQNELEYIPIKTSVDDYRAKRITAYLNLVNTIVNDQVAHMKKLPFVSGSDIVKYFELLDDESPVRKIYEEMKSLKDDGYKDFLQEQLRSSIYAGAIDVNIMSKVDKINYDKSGEPLPHDFSDALSALRGFANSNLNSSVVFSAGYNPHLYGYIEQFKDFFPDAYGEFKKKIILKVSDYRSALTQGKLLAKKGIWISEYRIESGLNCGGHAFATDGLLLGPILEEFKAKKNELGIELFNLCNSALEAKNIPHFKNQPPIRVTVQGGIGTANENNFLLDYYQTDSTGWGSPFLLVPEATNVDEETLLQLATAKKSDYYLSNASPLGVPFNNFKKSSSEIQRINRIEQGKPGSPCYKRFLVTNTEFSAFPICTASREYQQKKIKQLKDKNLSDTQYQAELETIIEKDCLCEGLSASVFIKDKMKLSHKLKAVTICPGPNLAYFSGIFSLKEMVDHIYGRINILNNEKRPNVFINELSLYVEYFKHEIEKVSDSVNSNLHRHLKTFKTNLLLGIEYYKNLNNSDNYEVNRFLEEMDEDLNFLEKILNGIPIPEVQTVNLA